MREREKYAWLIKEAEENRYHESLIIIEVGSCEVLNIAGLEKLKNGLNVQRKDWATFWWIYVGWQYCSCDLGMSQFPLWHPSITQTICPSPTYSTKSVIVHIKPSKMDLFRIGVNVYLEKADHDLCPLATLLGYIHSCSSDTDLLFWFWEWYSIIWQLYLQSFSSHLLVSTTHPIETTALGLMHLPQPPTLGSKSIYALGALLTGHVYIRWLVTLTSHKGLFNPRPQFSRLGSQCPTTCFYRGVRVFGCLVLVCAGVVESLSSLFYLARMLKTCFSIYFITPYGLTIVCQLLFTPLLLIHSDICY